LNQETDVTISENDLEVLVHLYEQSTWEEMELQIGGMCLYLGRGERRRGFGAASAVESRPAGAQLPAPAEMKSKGIPPAAEHAPVAAKQDTSGPELPEGCIAVPAPLLGCFYRSAKPGAAPYVEVGQRVEVDTELCLVEVMKLFTTVQAGVAGVVQEVLVKDGDMVEFGQPLFVINTRG
jgi:acetyl-CoA carboxylase biotin carboxyl carrier protein